MKYSLGRKALAVVCVFVVSAVFVVTAFAASKESNTNDYSTSYGTFHGTLYTNNTNGSAASMAWSTCTGFAPRLYAMDLMLDWATGATLASDDNWTYNYVRCDTDIIQSATSGYVTDYGYHGIYESNGSVIQTAGTQTVKV